MPSILFKGGELHPAWRGGRHVNANGYVIVLAPDHPKASGGYVYEHVLVAERALGRHLVAPEQVHHVNEVKSDNRPGNLVICPDWAYHALLHQRARALAACGNPTWRLCTYCQQHDDPERMVRRVTNGYAHRVCMNNYRRNRRSA